MSWSKDDEQRADREGWFIERPGCIYSTYTSRFAKYHIRSSIKDADISATKFVVDGAKNGDEFYARALVEAARIKLTK